MLEIHVGQVPWFGHNFNSVFGLRERNKEERKTQKLINEFELKLIYSSISVFFYLPYFFLSNQTHYKGEYYST
jgi:hypothetical protein